MLLVGDMNGWQHLHPDVWTGSDVLDFIYSLDGIIPEAVHGERFQDLSGVQFCRLTEQQFTMLDPQHGEIIYRRLHSLLSQQLPGLVLTEHLFI